MMSIISACLETWSGNSRWMSWNLFLALVPLGLSFCLFDRPRSRFLFWSTLTILGMTLWPNISVVGHHGFRLLVNLGWNYTGILIGLVFLLIKADRLWANRYKPDITSRSPLWWSGFFVFVAFLPNAPYVLTDIIHLYNEVRWTQSPWIFALILVPQFLLFMVIGFQAYVLSLMNLGQYLKQQGWHQLHQGAELLLHGLCSIGIYLGRFLRFNSWDIIVNPDDLVNSVMSDLAAKRAVLVIVVTFIIISSLYWLMKQITLGLIERQHKLQTSSFSS